MSFFSELLGRFLHAYFPFCALFESFSVFSCMTVTSHSLLCHSKPQTFIRRNSGYKFVFIFLLWKDWTLKSPGRCISVSFGGCSVPCESVKCVVINEVLSVLAGFVLCLTHSLGRRLTLWMATVAYRSAFTCHSGKVRQAPFYAGCGDKTPNMLVLMSSCIVPWNIGCVFFFFKINSGVDDTLCTLMMIVMITKLC